MAKLEREEGGLRCHFAKASGVLWHIVLLLFCQLLFGSSSVLADIYQCTHNRQPYFTDQPCQGGKVIRKTHNETPEEAKVRATAKRLKEENDLFERQLRIVVTELDNGNYWQAKQHAHDYGMDFDRVHAQWRAERDARWAARRAASRDSSDAWDARQAEQRRQLLLDDPIDQPRVMPAPPLAPTPPHTTPQPTIITNCDAAGCWDNLGGRYNKGAGNTYFPTTGGTCQQVGAQMICN